jgi:hypothetical protein
MRVQPIHHILVIRVPATARVSRDEQAPMKIAASSSIPVLFRIRVSRSGVSPASEDKNPPRWKERREEIPARFSF